MQIGIDLGATKIEYVLLDNDNKELIRNRVPTPNDYDNTLLSIINIVKDLEKKNNKVLSVGICHNSQWLNKKDIVKDLKKILKNNIYSENDANCFCLSEAFDGSASNYETVFGIILGSGCGGGFVINKKIISGSNGLGGEWSLNQMPETNNSNLKSENKLDFSNRIEGYLSGKSIEKNYQKKFKSKLTAKEIFFNYRNKDNNACVFINDYKNKLARSLVIIITTLDPDAIVFGGGLSNEIDFLDEIKRITSNLINEPNLKTIFLKPLYGDASGVRGAALLGRSKSI